MELTAISEVLQTIGGGSLSALVLVAGVILWRYGKPYMEMRKKEVQAVEHENMLRKMQIQVLLKVCEFLKEQGHVITVPDISEKI